MAFIIPSDEVARLLNSMETILRCLTGFYHDVLLSNIASSKYNMKAYSLSNLSSVGDAND